MLSQLLSGNLVFEEVLIMLSVYMLIIFLVLPFHEWAHAFAAKLLGDKSIVHRGRLTLNPLSHVDPIGALCIILFGFGWARPVEIDSRSFKNPKVGMGLSAAAGPLANIVAAFFGGLVLKLVMMYNQDLLLTDIGYYTFFFIHTYISVNISLAVFNLIPIPPLDGSKIMFMFLPDRWVYNFYKYERIFYFALIALIFADVIPIGHLSNQICKFIYGVFDIFPKIVLDYLFG